MGLRYRIFSPTTASNGTENSFVKPLIAVLHMQAEEICQALAALVHSDIRELLPEAVIFAAIMPEDLSNVPAGSLFVPCSEEEKLLHGELLEGLSQFFNMIPVTRPLPTKEKCFTEDVHIVCRPDVRDAAASDCRMRTGMRIAACAATSGQVASVAAADGLSLQSSTAAAALLATMAGAQICAAASASLEGAAECSISRERAALLCTHTPAELMAAVHALCMARLLRADPSSVLQLALTWQVHSAREAALQTCATSTEVSAAVRCFTEDRSADILGTPQERMLGGTVSLVLTLVTAGYVDVWVELCQAVRHTEASLRELDQFAENRTISVKLSLATNNMQCPAHTVPFSTKQCSPNLFRVLLMPPTATSHRTAASLALSAVEVNFPMFATLATTMQKNMGPTAASFPTALKTCTVDAQRLQELLASHAKRLFVPLRAHLVATGTVDQEFVPLDFFATEPVLNSCRQCMSAIETFVESTGASGVRLVDIFSKVALCEPLSTSSHPKAPCEYSAASNSAATAMSMEYSKAHDAQEDSAEALAQAAEILGGMFVLRNESIAVSGSLAFDCSLWPSVESSAHSTAPAAHMCAGTKALDASVQAVRSTWPPADAHMQDLIVGPAPARTQTSKELLADSHAAACKQPEVRSQRKVNASKHALVFAGIQVALSMLHALGSVTLQPHLGSSLSAVAAAAGLSGPHTCIMQTFSNGQESWVVRNPLGQESRKSETVAPCDQDDQTNIPSSPHAKIPTIGSAPSRLQQHTIVAAPWVLSTGGVNWLVLDNLIEQVHALLSAHPGMPEDLLTERMQHSLGRAHLRLLLQRMCDNNQLWCTTVPAHLTCQLSDRTSWLHDGLLVPSAVGLVPGIFESTAPCGSEPHQQGPLVLALQHHYFSDAASSIARPVCARDGVWV